MTWEQAYKKCYGMILDLRNRGVPAKGRVRYAGNGSYLFYWYDLSRENVKGDAVKTP